MKILHLDEVDSTNSHAKQTRDEGFDGDFIVINANRQTGGRGQGDHVWESEEGMNLTFSCIFKPEKLKICDVCKISQAVSLGVADFIKAVLENEIRDNVKLKWPNDVYVGDSKIAGILIENVFKGEFVDSSVIGIGININQVEFSEWIPNPVSLKLLSGDEYKLDCMLVMVCKSLYTRLKHLDSVTGEYCNILYQLNEIVEINVEGKIVQRRILGVDDFGELITSNS